MGETNIEWTDYSFNPWIGCSPVSPGCQHCYAVPIARRFRVKFGPGETRRPTSESYWNQPMSWNSKAAREGIRRRVFCASMADVFDNEGLEAERQWLWQLIEETSSLDWLLLTKRIGNIPRMLPERWREALPRNIWLGISVVNQEEADRDIPKLLRVPAAVRFLSCEPLIAPISLQRPGPWSTWLEPCGYYCDHDCDGGGHRPERSLISWVIVGGESGPGARPCVLGWLKDIVRECRRARVPVFVKQLGAHPTNREGEACPHIKHRKGADMAEWPEELRVREWPASGSREVVPSGSVTAESPVGRMVGLADDLRPGGWAYPPSGKSRCQGLTKDGRDCVLDMQHEGDCSDLRTTGNDHG